MNGDVCSRYDDRFDFGKSIFDQETQIISDGGDMEIKLMVLTFYSQRLLVLIK